MKIPCLSVVQAIKEKTLEKLKPVYSKKSPPRVALFYIGSDELIRLFIERKQMVAKDLKISFEVFHYDKVPLFQTFANDVRKTANRKEFHGIIIQRPLPAPLSSPTLDNFIPLAKEIEGQRYKSPYTSPVGMTVLSLLKYVDSGFTKWQIRRNDADYFKRNFKKKFMVLAGRGKTTGQPIAHTLVNHKLALVITHSTTPEPDQFYKQSDVIITTTGKPIIHAGNIKQGVTLMNFGYSRTAEGKTRGDYVDAEVDPVAGYYTPVINGTGPIMLQYLMKNVVDAYARQVK